MPNNYFKFKQFTVLQEHCAMKVCTDACLFGAYVADMIKTKAAASILDIGAGTGLLSLMLAQRVPAAIDAVEIDEAAYKQAKENFELSPWKERLNIFNKDILQFTTGKQYDCIISNPPFFENDLKSDDEKKNNAKHDTGLTISALLSAAAGQLQAGGIFSVLLPYHRIEYCIMEAAAKHLHLVKKVLVRQTEDHNYFRGILVFSKQPSLVSEETIAIKSNSDKYSARFAELLRDYYLYL